MLKRERGLPLQQEGAFERADSLNFRDLVRIISFNMSKLRGIAHTVGKRRISHLVVRLVVVIIIRFTVSLFASVRHRDALNDGMVGLEVV